MESNVGCSFEPSWLINKNVNQTAVDKYADVITSRRTLENEYKAAWLLKAITCIDLTTLSGDDCLSNVSRLCLKAARPLPTDLLKSLGFNYADNDCPIHTAAVCVYPAKVRDAFQTLKQLNFNKKVNVAAVATGFPSGQYALKTRLEEITFAVEQGASEIDIVIDRSLVLTGKWNVLYDELKAMKEACGNAHMKAILATGELVTLTNVYKASMVAMMAGADFIKTSTGKEAINATLQFGIVMARAINEYYTKTNIKVGLKPAGGIRTSQDALNWLIMIKLTLGDEWLTPELFRFGASGLLLDIECTLFELVTKKNALSHEFVMG